MFKISEIAKMLSVESKDVFEKIISHDSLLKPYISKNSGVIYIEERGIEILETIFRKNADHSLVDERAEIPNDSKFEKERKEIYNRIKILGSEIDKLDNEILDYDLQIKDLVSKISTEYERLIHFTRAYKI